MFARKFPLILVLLLCVSVFVGCEGEEGPAGPAGPAGATGPAGPAGSAGPSVVLCFGEINGEVDPAVVLKSWPAGVTVDVVDSGTGIWNVTLTGTFPADEGTILTTNIDSNAGRSMTGYITNWTTTSITFRVGIWNVIGSAFIDGQFSFIIMVDA